MTCDQALAALDRGDPIHVSGDEMRRFIAVMDSRRVGPSRQSDTAGRMTA